MIKIIISINSIRHASEPKHNEHMRSIMKSVLNLNTNLYHRTKSVLCIMGAAIICHAPYVSAEEVCNSHWTQDDNEIISDCWFLEHDVDFGGVLHYTGIRSANGFFYRNYSAIMNAGPPTNETPLGISTSTYNVTYLVSTSPINGLCSPGNTSLDIANYTPSPAVYDGNVCAIATVSNGIRVYIGGTFDTATSSFQNRSVKYSRTQNVGVEKKPQLTVVDGYIKLDTISNAEPLASDCDAIDHFGRMVYDHNNNRIYLCSSLGWSIY